MPTLLQLQYAIAVHQARHFGKAAKACRISQPTLSQQLQKLEDDVGVILFDRTKKPILPTPEGEIFLKQAQAVLREHEKLLHVSRQSQDGTLSGDFRLAVIPTVASDLLPHFVGPFSRAYPRVRLLIEEMKTETIIAELAADRLDGAILATPIAGLEANVHPLYYESFSIYFSGGHPLLDHPQVTRAQLDTTEMWLLQDGHCFKDQVLNYCGLPGGKKGSGENVRFQSGSLDTLRKLVRSSSGYTLIPELMALALRKDERTAHVRPFQSPAPTREISLVYRRDHWKLQILKAIEDTVENCLPEGIQRRSGKGQRVLDVC